MVYHCLQGTAPKYLSELCTLVAVVASRRQLRSVSQNVLLVPRYKLSGLGRRGFRVAGPLVGNSIADCLHDPALELASFKHQLKTFLFARFWTQRIERIRDAMTMRYIQGGPKSKPLPDDQKIVLNRVKACK